MFGRTQPRDHGNRQIKFLLRQALLPRLGPGLSGVALDLFAGRGEIAGRLYQGFREIHCVEKNPRSFAFLEKRFSPTLDGGTGIPACPQSPVIHLYRGDNLKFISEKVAGIAGLHLVDFDAYGSPNPQIKAFFQDHPVTEPMLIFATDGGKLARLRGRLWHPDWYSAREPEGRPASRYNPTIVRNYELLIRQFWRELSQVHGFRIQTFKLLWKQGKLVAYYGLLLDPL